MICVFDIDGTLIDSTHRHGALLKNILNEFGLSFPSSLECDYLDYKRKGYSTKKYLQEVLLIGPQISNEITEKWIEHIEDNEWIATDKLYEDVIQFLEFVCVDNKVFYLSCRSYEDVLLKELERLKIKHFASEIMVSKPSDGFSGKEKYLKKLKNNYKGKIIMFGDTELDLQAAKKAKCEYYILNRGFRSKEYWDLHNIVSFCSLPKEPDCL